VTLSDSALARVAECRAWVDQVVAAGRPVVYGVNTGFGVFANVNVDSRDAATLSRNLILSHSVGVGEPLPEEVVRAAMLVRANTLAIGHSGVRPQTLQTLIAMLNAGVHPVVPEIGSLGASGDLAPLSHLVLVMSRGDDASGWEDERWRPFTEGGECRARRRCSRPGSSEWCWARRRDWRSTTARPFLPRWARCWWWTPSA
jgi:histidine ammonia-lyase